MDANHLYLPPLTRVGFWNSLTRGVDTIQNWIEFSSTMLSAYEGDPTNKDWQDIEQRVIKLILEDDNEDIPLDISLTDLRQALYVYLCEDVGFNTDGHWYDLMERVFGVDVWEANKYPDGDNLMFRCNFNSCPVEETSGVLPSVGCFRKPHLIGDPSTGKTYFGLKSDIAELIEWAYTIPTYADFSALTVRSVVRFRKQNEQTIGPGNGDSVASNPGSWALYKDADNKINFVIHDGTSAKLITSAGTYNNEVVEVFGVVDGTDVELFINGNSEGTVGLDGIVPYYSEDKMYVGDNVSGSNIWDFVGTMFELEVNAAVITP